MHHGKLYPMALIGYRLLGQHYSYPFWTAERYGLWGRVYASAIDPGTVIGTEGEIVDVPAWDGSGEVTLWTSATVVGGHSIELGWSFRIAPSIGMDQQRVEVRVDGIITSTSPWSVPRNTDWWAQSVAIGGAHMGVPPGVPNHRATLYHGAVYWDGVPIPP